MCPFSILAFLQPTTVDKEPQNRLLANFEDLIHQNAYNLKVATPRIERFKFLRI